MDLKTVIFSNSGADNRHLKCNITQIPAVISYFRLMEGPSLVVPLAFECLQEAVTYYKINQHFTEDHLYSLYDLFGNMFEGAVELLENYTIKQYQSDDGFRRVYKVGNKKDQYTVYGNINFCYCPVFRYQVLEHNNYITCKHVLAVILADAMGKLSNEIVTASQMVEFLNEQLNHVI